MNPDLAQYPLIVLDRPRRWVMDLNAQIALGDALNVNIFSMAAVNSIMREPSPRHIRALVWAGLLREDPGLTLEQVGQMLDSPKKIMALTSVVMRHYAAATAPDPDGPTAQENEKAAEKPQEGPPKDP